MGRPTLILLLLLAAIGSWFFFTEMSTRHPGSADHGVPLNDNLGQAISRKLSATPQGRPLRDTIRVATLNLDNFDAVKMSRADIVQIFAQILINFDVVALQDITAAEQNTLPTLVDAANSIGGNLDFVIGPRVGRDSLRQFAFVYNQSTIEIDRFQLYSIQDPDDLIAHEPLVGWFRARGARPTEAFTFSLVNMQVDDTESVRENGITRAIFGQVRNDSRGEDDVILLGDFALDAPQLQELLDMPTAVLMVQQTKTNTQKNRSNINLIADRHATVELTGRGGVYDFLRELNLSMDQALAVTRHLPVWAEFSIYEGGQPGHVAANSALFGTRSSTKR